MASPLRKALESKAGLKRIHLRLPYIFLPPRFEKISNNRDLILLFKDDFTLHVRWSGALEITHHQISRSAAFSLILYVKETMSRYRTELAVVERFLDAYAENDLQEYRGREPTEWDKRKRLVELEKENEETLDDLLRFIEEQQMGESSGR